MVCVWFVVCGSLYGVCCVVRCVLFACLLFEVCCLSLVVCLEIFSFVLFFVCVVSGLLSIIDCVLFLGCCLLIDLRGALFVVC